MIKSKHIIYTKLSEEIMVRLLNIVISFMKQIYNDKILNINDFIL